MKRWLALALAAALLLTLAACVQKAAPPERKPQRICSYGGGGNLKSDTAYAYDKKGNVIRTEHYTGGKLVSAVTYENTYDKKGRLVCRSSQNAEGETAEEAYEYGASGQLVRMERSGTWLVDGVASLASMPYREHIEYTYDAQGQLVLSESRAGENVTQTTYTYNAQGQKIREDTRSADGIEGSITYEYDAEGLLSRKSFYTDVGTPHEWLEGYEIYEY